MAKTTMIIALMLAGTLLTALPCFSQEDMQTIDNSDFARPHRSPALFAHDDHNEMAEIDDCGVCHHVFIDGQRSEFETSEDQSCVECHSVSAPENRFPLRRAFHVRCTGCHLARNAGPILCAGCHPVE